MIVSTISKILLVEDNIEYANRITQGLNRAFQIEHVQSVGEAVRLIQQKSFELILLDIDLGVESGFDLAIHLKSENQKTIPIIYLTAKSGSADRITGFTLGADDFIQKTVDLIELEVRIKNVLSRTKAKSSLLEMFDMSIDLLSRRAFVIEGSSKRELSLSPTEFNILAFFMKHAGQALSRNQILDAIWGQKLNVTDRTIDTHIFSLRKKLESKATLIESVFGIGYRFSDLGYHQHQDKTI